MKRVMSVSLGSSNRNHKGSVNFLGEEYLLERIGTDGDPQKMKKIFLDNDGKVDAFGLGGFDLYLTYKNKKYVFREAYDVIKDVKQTPIADGSGVKKTLEKDTIKKLFEEGIIDPSKKVLMPSAAARYYMYEAFKELGFTVVWGDLAFALGVASVGIVSPITIGILTTLLLPVVVRLPFKMLYPVGEKQDEITPKYKNLYDLADIIAGDFHFIRRYMPDSLEGKIIITNTLTQTDVEELRKRKVNMIITTTPEFSGRSFATNVIEAFVCAALGKKAEEITDLEFRKIFKELRFEPRVIKL
jgi:hypothetical protein